MESPGAIVQNLAFAIDRLANPQKNLSGHTGLMRQEQIIKYTSSEISLEAAAQEVSDAVASLQAVWA